VVATDMGGTSFDIGIVVQGGVKYYDFNPIIDRWLVSVPMVHLVTLGAGGGSIAPPRVRHGCGRPARGPTPVPPGRSGGMNPTVTDADLCLAISIRELCGRSHR
jgi:N-methylhydantoinase A